MAGPTATVLLPERLDSAGVALCARTLHGRASHVEGDSFWIGERPFISRFGEEFEGELAEIVEAGLPEVLGWVPVDAVWLAAMCNAPEDHQLLGELCMRVAQEYGGIIDFGGTILEAEQAPQDVRRPAARVENPSGLSGTLFTTWYQIDSGVYARTQYGDLALLRSWLGHPNFRMVK